MLITPRAILLQVAVMSVLPVPLNVRGEHQAVLELPTTRPAPTLPVANATESFWLRSPGVYPSPTEGSDGPLTSDADICIIGSGITGISAAYHLAQSYADRGNDAERKPLKVVVLEAREFCQWIYLIHEFYCLLIYSNIRLWRHRSATD